MWLEDYIDYDKLSPQATYKAPHHKENKVGIL